MAAFEPAVELVLRHEKGLVDNPNDPGGITNLGISLRFLQSLPEETKQKYGIPVTLEGMIEYIKNITPSQAKALYQGEFWDQALFHKINNQNVCNYIFDSSINMGISVAIKIAQRAANAVNRNLELIEDGVLGNKTLDQLNHINTIILSSLRSERAGEYKLIASRNPLLKSNLNGWLNRAYKT